ncbi:MAG: DEAD/DEAH box helicase [Ruthenibacterium sp.]
MTVDGQIHLSDVPDTLLHTLQKMLTVSNPAFQSALRMGRPTYGIKRNIMLYEIKNNEFIVPRGLWLTIWNMRPAGTVKHLQVNQLPEINFPNNSILLLPHQERALQAIATLGYPQGVIVMPCGSGKTETAMELIARTKQPALWITHTHDLVEQAVNRAQRRLGLHGAEIGVLAGGQRTVGTHLTVATVQTLNHLELDDYAALFGMVVVDECHRVVNNPETASMFAAVLSQFPAKYRFGLTASDTRSDGLTDTIFHVLGDKVVDVSQETLNISGKVIIPAIQPVCTAFEYLPASGESPVNFQRLQKFMAADRRRNDMIIAYLQNELLNKRSCLVLASGLDVLKTLYEAIRTIGISAAFVCGGTKKADRTQALKEMQSGAVKCLFATYQLAKEGLDIPCLSCLVLASPVRNMVSVQQSIGRVMRTAAEKTDAIVYDFVDKKVGVCKSQYTTRKRVYKSLHCEIRKEIIYD